MKVLITFYENRLKDHYVVTPPVLQGLRALVSLCMLDFQYQGCLPQKNADIFLCKVDGSQFPLLWWWPVVTCCFSSFFSRQSAQCCLLARLWPCWRLCFTMFMFRWNLIQLRCCFCSWMLAAIIDCCRYGCAAAHSTQAWIWTQVFIGTDCHFCSIIISPSHY